MAATVTISETNTASATVTPSVSTLNAGSADMADLYPGAFPIAPATNSYEKWFRLNWSAGEATRISNLKVWCDTEYDAVEGVRIYTNAATAPTYAGAQTYPAAGPSRTDRSATYDYTNYLGTSEPASANLGIGGDPAGALTATGYSDYLIFQVQVAAGTAASDQVVAVTIQWDEDE